MAKMPTEFTEERDKGPLKMKAPMMAITAATADCKAARTMGSVSAIYLLVKVRHMPREAEHKIARSSPMPKEKLPSFPQRK